MLTEPVTVPQQRGAMAPPPPPSSVADLPDPDIDSEALADALQQVLDSDLVCTDAATAEDDNDNIAYRNPRMGEHPSVLVTGFYPKNLGANYSVTTHVRRGSSLKTQYISLTRSLDVARGKQNPDIPIYVIDLDLVVGEVIDLSIPNVRDARIPRDQIARNYAASSAEVLVLGWIPPEAIRGTINFMQSVGN
ncbi:hypothetical protein HC928_17005 [bacterium]|nr:hypothetical protein [bacterium]